MASTGTSSLDVIDSTTEQVMGTIPREPPRTWTGPWRRPGRLPGVGGHPGEERTAVARADRQKASRPGWTSWPTSSPTRWGCP